MVERNLRKRGPRPSRSSRVRAVAVAVVVALDLLALSNCRQITSDFSEEEKGEKSRTREENEEHHVVFELRLGYWLRG